MKTRQRFFVGLLAALALGATPFDFPVGGEDGARPRRAADPDCLYGRVKVVTAFPDYRVRVVDAFPDLRVQKVDSFPDKCGKWQMVDSFPDFTVQYVDSFPDLRIQFVEAFPGKP